MANVADARHVHRPVLRGDRSTGSPLSAAGSSSTARSASAATPRRCSTPRRRPAGRHRPRPRGARARARAARALRRAGRARAGDFRELGELGSAPGGRSRRLLADLGVSSLQLDRAERGFTFQRDGPLDMRMGRRRADGGGSGRIVRRRRSWSTIFREYGEEPRGARAWRARSSTQRRRAADRDARSALARRGAARQAPRPRRRGAHRSGDARLPGAAHRGQRGARRARGAARPGGATARPRRPAGGHLVPQPRGPDRQEPVPRSRPRRDRPDHRPHALRDARARGADQEARRARRRPRSRRNPRSRSARLRAARRL